ncbi:unnamed protein product [Ilex paraguariensis]|uniref:Uncharacterized protein n=1 Tax=Ilex paraguariensis TaxID=185542 RepID=A0ABC8UT39_9AQUA
MSIKEIVKASLDDAPQRVLPSLNYAQASLVSPLAPRCCPHLRGLHPTPNLALTRHCPAAWRYRAPLHPLPVRARRLCQLSSLARLCWVHPILAQCLALLSPLSTASPSPSSLVMTSLPLCSYLPRALPGSLTCAKSHAFGLFDVIKSSYPGNPCAFAIGLVPPKSLEVGMTSPRSLEAGRASPKPRPRLSLAFLTSMRSCGMKKG